MRSPGQLQGHAGSSPAVSHRCLKGSCPMLAEHSEPQTQARLALIPVLHFAVGPLFLGERSVVNSREDVKYSVSGGCY